MSTETKMGDENNNKHFEYPENPEDFDFSSLTLERGDTPQDIKERCFDLCHDYLGGVWRRVNIDDIEVKRLSGGLTNQLYYCALNEDHRKLVTTEPKEVAIRLYLEKHFNNTDHEGNERLTDVIIALIMSEKNLGPKIYGLFEGGQIQKYYQHQCFRTEQHNDLKLVQELAQKLARIHSTVVPIKKNSNWIFDFFDNSYDDAYKLFDLKALYRETNCETLLRHDLKDELEWLKKVITEIDSPITFTHIDFR
ncbi:unnamed protein product, partial [Oppiella nova]